MPSQDYLRARRKLKLKTGGVICEIVKVGSSQYSSDGKIWVRYPGGYDNGAPATVRNHPFKVRPKFGNFIDKIGRKVWVGEGYDSLLEIKDNVEADLKQRNIDARQLNPNNKTTQLSMTFENLNNFQSFAKGTDGTVLVFPGTYRKSDGDYATYSGETGIDLLTSYTPATSTNQLVVCLWIDTDDGTVNVTASSEVSQSLDLKKADVATGDSLINECVATAPTNNIGLWSWIVRGDDTIITEDNKYKDIRGMVGSYGGVPPSPSADIIVTGTAGETLAELDNVYLDTSSDTWFKIDIDATSPILCGRLRGVVTESGGISSAATGDILRTGVASGYTGLTSGSPIYASATAGGYIQTRPSDSGGGGQLLVAEMGVAISTTEALIDPKPVIFAMRDELDNNDTLTIEHYSNAQTRQRDVRAYVVSDEAGAELAAYASANQDSDVALEGPTLAGDSITISASGIGVPIGDISGTEIRQGQSFTTVNGGNLTSFTFDLVANVGTPSGDITWQIMTDDGTDPDTEVATGTITPTASATNTVNGIEVLLSPATKYWLVLSTVAQATNSRYQWDRSTSSVYAGGNQSQSNDGGSTWTPDATDDCDCAFTISATVEATKLVQSFQVTGTQTVETVKLWLKKTGSPTGTMTLRIETDNTGEPSGTLADANLTVTVAESGLSTSYGAISFTFSTPASISGSTTYWLVLSTDRSQSDTNYVAWGADGSTPGYSDGEMLSEVSSSWGAESKDAIFEITGAGTQYDEPAVIGRWSGGTRDIAVRFDDGAAGSTDTKTTFKNVTGDTVDAVVEVELA